MYYGNTNIFLTSFPVNCEARVFYENVDGFKTKFEQVVLSWYLTFWKVIIDLEDLNDLNI